MKKTTLPMTKIYPKIRVDQKKKIIQESKKLKMGHAETTRHIIDSYFNNTNKQKHVIR